MLLLLLIFSFAEADLPVFAVNNFLNGYEMLTQKPTHTIFRCTFNENNTTPDGKFKYCDGIDLIMLNRNDLTVRSEMYYTYEDYKTSMNAKFSVSGKYGPFSGSISGQYQETSEYVYRSNTTITRTYVLLEEVQVSINAGDAPFDPYFLKYITMYLPAAENITQTDAFNFFAIFGDVFPIQTNLGGLCEEYSYTTDTYVSQSDSQSVTTQASAKFFIDAEADYSQQSSITQAWEQATSIMVVNTLGGQWDGNPKDFTEWVQSVSTDYSNLQPVSAMQLSPITSVFQFPYITDKNIQAKGIVLDKYLAMWVARPGCTNPAAPNYNCSATVDDGSCQPHVIVYKGNCCSDCPYGIVGSQNGYSCKLGPNESLVSGYTQCVTIKYVNQFMNPGCEILSQSFEYSVAAPSLSACYPIPLF